MEFLLMTLIGLVIYAIGAILAFGRANAENEDQGGDLMQGFIVMVMIICVIMSWFYFIVSSVNYLWEKEWREGIKYMKFKEQ